MKEHKSLSRNKILQILKDTENIDNVELVDWVVDSGTESGDNYSGELLRCDIEAQVNGEERKYHWIAKLPNANRGKWTISQAVKMEEKEVCMYNEYLPNLKAFIKSKAPGVQMNFCHSPYAHFDSDYNKGETMIILENMKHLGFGDAKDKKKGLLPSYVRLVLEELAKFHASSYAYFKSYPGGVAEATQKYEILSRDYAMSEGPEMVKQLNDALSRPITAMINGFLEASQSQEENFVDSFKAYLDSHGGNIYRRRNELIVGKPDDFKTLCHLDTWFNNMLFHHEHDKPTKCALIDLAVSRWGSPISDLAYFFFISTTPELRRTHTDEFLGHYHKVFAETMTAFGEDDTVLTLSEIKRKYHEQIQYGFITSLAMMPGCIARKEDAFTEEEMAADWEDPESLKAMMERVVKKTKLMFDNEPHMKRMTRGNFLELVDGGHIKLL